MEERPESDADDEVRLRPEDVVAADEAMLLDLGGAEELADLIAAQALGATRTTSASGAPTETAAPAPSDEDEPSPEA